MSFTYRYKGDLPTVFIELSKDNQTWVPSKGDTITSDALINHPLLELVVIPTLVVAESKSEIKDSPVTLTDEKVKE